MIEEDISKSRDEMDEQFINEYMEAADTDTFEAFAEDWGMTVEEAHKAALNFSALDGFVPEGTTLNETDEADTFTKNGVTIDTSGDIDPVLLGMTGGKGGMFKAGANKLANKIFASKNLKANQVAKGGKEGQRIANETQSKSVAGTGLKPAVSNKTADKYNAMKDRVVKKNQEKVAQAGTTAAAATAIGLSGNRNKDGDFVSALNEDTPRETVDLGQPDGVEPLPDTVETMGNQYGYHKQEGQNFWTVNNDDPYWDTHEIGTGDAWSDAELKKAPAKELDWSSWFN